MMLAEGLGGKFRMSESASSSMLDRTEESAPHADPDPLAGQIDELVHAAGVGPEESADQALETDVDRMIEASRHATASQESPEEVVRRLDEHLSATAEGRMDQRNPLPDLDPQNVTPAAPSASVEVLEPVAGAVGEALTPSPEEPPEPVVEAAMPVEMPEGPITASPNTVPLPAWPIRVGRLLPKAMAWPLSHLTPAGRDLIGWFALVTLFNAACLWAYLLIPD